MVVTLSFSRCSSGAADNKAIIIQARVTDGAASTISIKKNSSGMPTRAALRRFFTSSRTIPNKKAQCIPETAVTCVTPVSESWL